jgi:hypothetical protein
MDKWWFSVFSVYDFTNFCVIRIPAMHMLARHFHGSQKWVLSIKLRLCQIVTTSNSPAQDKNNSTA